MHGCSCVFFFSSRRRHTRCSRDWSSDVCSSDLPPRGALTTSALPPTLVATSGSPQLAASIRATGKPSETEDRKSTRLNSSHGYISYAVFCLKKKKKKKKINTSYNKLNTNS